MISTWYRSLSGRPDGFWNRFEQEDWGRKIGSVELNVFHAQHAINEGLSHFDVFHPIELEGLRSLC